MWELIARFILRQRIPILIGVLLVTIFMGYKSTDTRLQWTLPRLLPDDDSTLVANREFKEIFGYENVSILLGTEEPVLDSLEFFNDWYSLGNELAGVNNVDTVLSVAHLLTVEKNADAKRFELKPIVKRKLRSQSELDSIRAKIKSLPFYRDRVYNDSTGVSVMAISVNPDVFNSPDRESMMDSIITKTERFEAEHGIDLRYSGLPFIRTETTRLVKGELSSFIIYAVIVTIIVLLFFFRSAPPVFVSMLIVLMGVVWSLGIIAVLDYEITILTSIIPPLIIVIGIPNSVYLINKYHAEYTSHGNKILALSRIIRKIGKATLMTNVTTAVGFSTFIFTQSNVLVEFGIVASINILLLFVLSIFLVPSILSFLKPPKSKHTKHLDKPFIKRMVENLVRVVSNYRKPVYIVTLLLIGFGVFGLSRMETTGNLVDDLPKDHQVVEDLHFFENQFDGVMPFEIIIDTRKEGMATRSSTLRKIDELEQLLGTYDEFSKPLSIVGGIKFARQAFYGGDPSQYRLIASNERIFFRPYLKNAGGGGKGVDLLNSFVDSTERYARVTAQMKDIGTKEMDTLIKDLKPKVDEIFSPDKYEVDFAGTSIVYLKGTNYLVKNLVISLVLAIVLIGILMAVLFSSFRMIAMSIFTNLIPLLLTAAIMGYFGIPIKPSTILVFSIAFGISIDDTIHYLAKYRQELKAHNWNVRIAAINSIRETGVSMIYTSIILFFGFSVFATSQFGGTQALGILVSITLLVAMVANLVLLPSLLLNLDKSITTKAFKEPFLQILDEEDANDYSNLQMKNEEDDSDQSSKT